VDNYDIDAIHFDDIFTHIKVAKTVFPTRATYDKYKKAWPKARRLAKDRMSTN